MTQRKPNGGPAFPLQSAGPDFAPGYAGMTLRDWFAGQVLSADDQSSTPAASAAWAYKVADAMLAERDQ